MKDFDKKVSIESGEELDLKEVIKIALSSTPDIVVIGELTVEEINSLKKGWALDKDASVAIITPPTPIVPEGYSCENKAEWQKSLSIYINPSIITLEDPCEL